MLITIPKIELQTWTKDIAPDVDPQLALDIEPYLVTDEDGQPALEVTVSGNAGGAGLVSTIVDWPLVRGVPLPYAGTDWLIKPSVAAAANVDRVECDTIGVFPGALPGVPQQNHYNGSAQLNLSLAKGTWEDGNWTPTSFDPGPLPADVWTLVKVRYQYDYNAKTITVTSIAQGAQSEAVNQTFPADTTNWGFYPPGGGGPFAEQVLQAQLKLINAGAASQRYRVTVYYSDQPIS